MKKPALPWYWTHSLSIIKLSYLLAFVQLTRQVDNDWFLPGFGNFFMEFINIGPVYIRGWGGQWWKLKHRSKKTQIVQVMMYTCTHKRPTKPRQMCTDIGSQIGALLWCHFTSCGFTWSAKSTLKKQTSWH